MPTPNGYFYNTTPAQGSENTAERKERKQKDCKRQRTRKSTVSLCLLEIIKKFYSWDPNNVAALINLNKYTTSRHANLERGALTGSCLPPWQRTALWLRTASRERKVFLADEPLVSPITSSQTWNHVIQATLNGLSRLCVHVCMSVHVSSLQVLLQGPKNISGLKNNTSEKGGSPWKTSVCCFCSEDWDLLCAAHPNPCDRTVTNVPVRLGTLNK